MSRGSAISNRTLAACAFVGLAFFPLAVVVLNVVQAGHYDPLRQPMSQLALGADGWLMTGAFYVFGLASLLLALVLRRTLPGARAIPALLTVVGISNFTAAVFPTDATGVQPTVHGLIHNIGGLASFVLMVILIVVAGLRFRTVLEWASFSRTSLVWGGFAIAGFFLMLGLGAAGYFGLGQRISVGIWLLWLLVVAWRALRFGPLYAGANATPLRHGSSEAR